MIAITRPVSASLAACELTHLAREPITVARAATQHAVYEQLLGSLGATLVQAPAAPDFPDAVFIEDTAVVLDEVAVLTRPGAPSRRGELDDVATVLARYRRLLSMAGPATLDGGDVLRLGRTLYVGRAGRTNDAGIEQLRSLVAPFDYQVIGVAFSGCLHLKSAVTDVADGLLLLNPAWVSADAFAGCEGLPVDEHEPHAANALRFGDRVIFPAQHPRTRDRLRERACASSFSTLTSWRRPRAA